MLQRNRWQQVTNEAVWEYRHMLLNPRYGWFGFLTMPYFVLYEMLGVLFEVSSLAITAVGFFTGHLDVRYFVSFYMLMLLTQAVNSLITLSVFSREQDDWRAKDLLYFAGLSLAEFFWYRPILTVAKLGGTLDWLRGVRHFDQAKRIGASSDV